MGIVSPNSAKTNVSMAWPDRMARATRLLAKRSVISLLAVLCIHPAFSQKYGPDQPKLSHEQWHEDLNYLVSELLKRHANPFHLISRETFEAEANRLDARLDTLNSDEIFVGFDQLENSIGDGHTGIRIPTDAPLFPVAFGHFGADYRLIAGAPVPDMSQLVGLRLVAINDVPISQVEHLLMTLTPGDETPPLQYARATLLLNNGMILHGLGILQSRESVRYTFATDHGEMRSLELRPSLSKDHADWVQVTSSIPLYRQRPDDGFWCTYLAPSQTAYCSFRTYADLDKRSAELFALVSRTRPLKLVLDMRLNDGGDFDLGLKYLVEPIKRSPAINRRGHLFILIGPRTYSAGMANASHFREQTNAILVGQTIGEKPNSYQEARDMTLPNSHWIARYSITFYKFTNGKENLLKPDVEIPESWNDFKTGRDPVLDWVLNEKNAK